MIPHRQEPSKPAPVSRIGRLSPRDAVTRLVNKIREVGALFTLTLGMRRLIPAAVYRYTRMAILEIVPSDLIAVAVDESVRWATFQDLRLLTSFGHAPEILEHRFTAGARACILTEGQELLAYVWFHSLCHQEEDLGVRFDLDPGEIWLFDAMVKKGQRGRGFYPRLLQMAVRDLGREGVRRILIAIEAANRNSIRAHEAAGAASTGRVTGLRILGWTFVRHGGKGKVNWTGSAGYVRLSTSSIAG
jgi:GNAT superfamily N-acetyltransferase